MVNGKRLVNGCHINMLSRCSLGDRAAEVSAEVSGSVIQAL